MTEAPTDTLSRPLAPATEAMTLLVAAVIVHDRETDGVVLLQLKRCPSRWRPAIIHHTEGFAT
ncbi:hypothetical protein ACFY19_31160 [Streptosporangium saharense]|uniref:hypothetical protein n=1 Tax=Streptosporangium saharense TaxID=1706840 RepID=UPI003689F24C